MLRVAARAIDAWGAAGTTTEEKVFGVDCRPLELAKSTLAALELGSHVVCVTGAASGTGHGRSRSTSLGSGRTSFWPTSTRRGAHLRSLLGVRVSAHDVAERVASFSCAVAGPPVRSSRSTGASRPRFPGDEAVTGLEPGTWS
jgi:hypothetical protein